MIHILSHFAMKLWPGCAHAFDMSDEWNDQNPSQHTYYVHHHRTSLVNSSASLLDILYAELTRRLGKATAWLLASPCSCRMFCSASSRRIQFSVKRWMACQVCGSRMILLFSSSPWALWLFKSFQNSVDTWSWDTSIQSEQRAEAIRLFPATSGKSAILS